MMTSTHGRQTAKAGNTRVDPNSSGWHTLEDALSDIDGEEEDETDELIEDEENLTLLQPFRAPDGVMSEDLTRSRAHTPQSNSTRTVSRTSTITAITNNNPATTDDALASPSSASKRKQKKRQRRASISDSGNSHHRPVKQHRSRAPSPPSLPSSQRLPESGAFPLSSSSYANSDSARTPHSVALPLATGSGSTPSTVSTAIQHHVSVPPAADNSTVVIVQDSTDSHGVQPRYILIDPADRTDVTALLMQLVVDVRSRNDASRLDATTASEDAADISMDVDDVENDEPVSVNASQMVVPDAMRESISPRGGGSAPLDPDASSADHASSAYDHDEDPGYNARRSRMFLRSLGASYHMRVNPHVPAANAGRTVPRTPLILRNPIAVSPYTPGAEAWTQALTSVYGPGSETRGLDKPKLPRKPRTKAGPSHIDTTSVPPSAATSVRALSESASVAGSSAQPIDVDAPTEEELQEQANGWAALVRSFVKGKSTRARNGDTLLKALCDAGTISLSSLVLARSGLYAAARALGDSNVAAELSAAHDAARALADKWVEKYGECALEEEV